jgi:hypothetical protein
MLDLRCRADPSSGRAVEKRQSGRQLSRAQPSTEPTRSWKAHWFYRVRPPLRIRYRGIHRQSVHAFSWPNREGQATVPKHAATVRGGQLGVLSPVQHTLKRCCARPGAGPCACAGELMKLVPPRTMSRAKPTMRFIWVSSSLKETRVWRPRPHENAQFERTVPRTHTRSSLRQRILRLDHHERQPRHDASPNQVPKSVSCCPNLPQIGCVFLRVRLLRER